MQGAQVRPLVRELDPTCMPQLRVLMPQLRSPHAATKELESAMHHTQFLPGIKDHSHQVPQNVALIGTCHIVISCFFFIYFSL